MIARVLSAPYRAIRSSFGYDAIEETGKRKAPTGILRSEDNELLPSQRKQMVGGSRDIYRNFAIAGWMVRKHLDYVSSFSLQVKSENNDLANAIERDLNHWGEAGNCEMTCRHSLRRFIRLAELRRTVDGDVGILRLKNGRLQAIEGDRIRTPEGGWPDFPSFEIPIAQARHGVLTDQYGRPTKYSICRRATGSDWLPTSGGFQFERFVDANHLFLHAYFDRFDQSRGISPIAAGLNSLRDVYEGFNYALAKMKVSQLFGMVFTTTGEEPLGNHSETDDSTDSAPKYNVDFGKGPVKLELEPGEDAKFLSVDTPGISTQEFLNLVIGVALKSLDIPFSFYNESFTNYSGARQAWIQYDQSAEEKRADVRALLDWITAWKIQMWILEGRYPGADLSQFSFNWIPKGVPWIDPMKEIQAVLLAVDGGLMSLQDAAKVVGKDWFQIMDARAVEIAYAAKLNVPLGAAAKIPQQQDTPDQQVAQ